jgi:class 3 adenylate cyclase/tetratricopeptide (TPR) repeat protein
MPPEQTGPASGLFTILFTDLVGSTELLSRAGDEDAQRIFRAHHSLLAEVAASHKGEEVKWLGDGLMVAFPSAAEAVRAAVAMQQASRRPVEGERLAIRVGLNAGEALRDAADYFGTAVVVARRLCDRAGPGQILCSDLVAGLLAGQTAFSFVDLGAVELKGVPRPVAACEIEYEAGDGAAAGLAREAPCVGRDAELARLSRRLSEASAGRGGLVLVTGDPGMGKTRLVEELATQARRDGAVVAWGRCFEGEWAPPYAPFAEILGSIVSAADPDELRADLGGSGPVLAQLAPELRGAVPDLPEAVPLSPDEERFRLLDATARFLLARSERAPVVCCLDDFQWADGGTIAMLRHLARFAPRHRLLLVAAYRDAEVGPGHPLADALGAFPRETDFERLRLEGLSAEGTARLLAALGDQDVEEGTGRAWVEETDGNPFFIGELLRHLVEEGKVYRGPDGRWTTDRPLRELGVPDTVRDVVVRRLARLSEETRRLLSVACAFEGPFRFDVAARLAQLREDPALDAVDEASAAQVLRAEPGGTCAFAHAVIRHTLYEQLNPLRRTRLHRRVAEALEAAYGKQPTPAQAGEIAVQYHRSGDLPGAERGVEPALAAASAAQATGGHDEAVRFLRLALDLLPEGDDRRPGLLGRLGIVLAWALAFDEAAAVAAEAGDAIAESEGKQAAAEYLSDATYVCSLAGAATQAWDLARQGLTYAGPHDVAWARLISFDLERRVAEDPEYPGIPTDNPERRESARILREARLDPLAPAPMEAVFDSLDEALQCSNLAVLTAWAGEYARCIPLFEAEAFEAESLGRHLRAARAWGILSYCAAALGDLERARQAIERTHSLAARLAIRIPGLIYADRTLAGVLDEGWEELGPVFRAVASSPDPAFAWFRGYAIVGSAEVAARLGRWEEALGFLDRLVPWLERAPAWAIGFPVMACGAAETLWLLGRLDHVELVEQALRRLLQADFRYPGKDVRLALARVGALTGRHDEATSWFAEARRVLEEAGERPLRAIVDFDEALMLARRGEPGDAEAAQPLLESARRQFEAIGMTGWLRRADDLARRLDEGAP